MRTATLRHPGSKTKHTTRAWPRQSYLPSTEKISLKTNVPTFVASLKARGVKLTVVGEDLHVDAPRGTLSDLDQERLWQSLEGVRTLLTAES